MDNHVSWHTHNQPISRENSDSPFEWKQHTTHHLHVHTLRERIVKAWQILTTGQTQYEMSFSYYFGGDEDLLSGTSITIEGESLIPLPKEDTDG